MSARNCAAIHNDARWRAECWAPVRQRLIELGYQAEYRLPDLNRGGCGLFAALVGERLIKLGYRARIVVSGWELSTSHSLNFMGRRAMPTMPWQPMGLALADQGMQIVTHVLLRVYGEVYDSRGFAEFTARDPTFGDPYYKGSLSVETGLALAADKAAWSVWFDRDKGEPIIRQLINDYLPAGGNI